MSKEKVVLAYSGGLDTTAIIPWLKENFGYDVICCCIDCGQGEELDGLDERAKLSGASKLYIENIVDDFCDNYIVPCVKAGAVYENKYLLGTSMARPAIAKKLVEIARKEGAVAICHGATGKGNDQIRFELGIKALAPDIKIIAPWRMTDVWTMQSREDEIEYCRQHGIDLPFDAQHSYSRDRNLWHISHEGLELEDPANEPNYDDLLVLGVTPEKAPDKGEYVTMTFEAGVPKSVNGKEMKVSDIIKELNALGGKHGIGIIDIVENRVVGMKSRGVYETPGGTILMEAHQQLEELVLDLRYNGGGYVITENVLASLFAPQEAVDQKLVFEQEDYNDYLTEEYRKLGVSLETRFATEFEYQDGNVTKKVSTKGANIGLKKVYGLIGSGSASASEALLGGLMPYMDVQLIGSQTHGKYCTGWMMAAKEAYKLCPKAIEDWGIYVMVSIYQNADGETPCMPDGMVPDVEVADVPLLPYRLGDINEPLLLEALIAAGLPYDGGFSPLTRGLGLQFGRMPDVRKPVFGRRILLPPAALLEGMR